LWTDGQTDRQTHTHTSTDSMGRLKLAAREPITLYILISTGDNERK